MRETSDSFTSAALPPPKLNYANSGSGKDSLPSQWKLRVFKMATQKDMYMDGIALGKGKGNYQHTAQLRVFEVWLKYSSKNAIEHSVCDPRSAQSRCLQ